jgi:hypothetical protein
MTAGLPVWYMQELEGVRGLRYAYSLFLEATDFLGPLLQRLLGRLGNMLSWLLVCLIGRSLGLVYRGVRESLIPGRKPGEPPRSAGQQRMTMV